MPDLARVLAATEDDLARMRTLHAKAVAWINDPGRELAPRQDLARHLGVPEPAASPTLPGPRRPGCVGEPTVTEAS
jgi:hypothetical protein